MERDRGASLVELVWRHPLAALAARGSAVPGAVFAALCLATGSIWGRPAWGTWWVWDGRLTSMLVLLFLYFGYIALAGAVEREGGSSRHPGDLRPGRRGQHPDHPLFGDLVEHAAPAAEPALGASAMSSAFLWALLAATLGFTLLFAGVVLARMRALLAADPGRGAAAAQGAEALMRESLDPWPFVIAAYALDDRRDAGAGRVELAGDAPRRAAARGSDGR